jgi:hypothetical protein
MTFSQIHHKPAHYIVTFFLHSSEMNKPFVTFHKIRHGWRTNSLVSTNPPIVFCLRGMNISCWFHMSDLHKKNFWLPKCNIMSSWWPTWHMSYPIFMPKPSTHRMYDPGPIAPHIRPKVITDNQMSRIRYNYYINNISKDYDDSQRNGTAEDSITPQERQPGQHIA